MWQEAVDELLQKRELRSLNRKKNQCIEEYMKSEEARDSIQR